MYRIGARGDTDQARASPTPEHADADLCARSNCQHGAPRCLGAIRDLSALLCERREQPGSTRVRRDEAATVRESEPTDPIQDHHSRRPSVRAREVWYVMRDQRARLCGSLLFLTRVSVVTGYNRQLGLKNHSCEEVEERFGYLRNTLGMKTPKHNEVGFGVFERERVSVQGFWRNQKDLGQPVLPSEIELRERRRREYNLQSVLDEFGAEGVVRITQKLLERQEAKRASALAALPVVEKVRATE